MNIIDAKAQTKILKKWRIITAALFVSCFIIISYILGDYKIRIPLVLLFAALSGSLAARFVYAFKTRRSNSRKIWLGFLTVFTTCWTLLMVQWKTVSDNGGQVRQEPFRIAGNLYYVGTKDVTSFLLTSSHGHVLIDGGYPGTASLIMKNIIQLGFKITDVKILLNSHGHLDHAGGLYALQKASGAQLWVSEPEASLIRTGGLNSRSPFLMNLLVYSGMARFPAPHINRTFKDGAKISLGPINLTAHVTPGHTPGCTSWSFLIYENGQKLNVVSIGSLSLIPTALFGKRFDEQQQDEYHKSFNILRGLPEDIYLGAHADIFDMRRKLLERKAAKDSIKPFIDRNGYLSYISRAEQNLRNEVQKQ